ncbi:MAG: ACP S-malonyltransferase [Catenulispora sp.]|nr:ACP S-malonyltransferase [Catenulispora sp.]
MFPGQGSQYYGMGRELLSANAVFARSMRRMDEAFAAAGLPGTLAEIYRDGCGPSTPFDDLRFTHPAILMVELSLLDVMHAEGIEPDYVLGASLGEYAAAVAVGALDPGDLATVIARQVDLVHRHCPPGAMLAVFDDAERYSAWLRAADCEVAAVNSDSHFVVTGPPPAVEAVARAVADKGVAHQRLAVGFAFHSRQMEGAAKPYLDLLGSLHLRTPRVPMISCARAGILPELTADHLWRMVRSPIRFRDAIRFVEREIGEALLVDLGPSGTFANFAKQVLGPGSAAGTIAPLNPFASKNRGLDQLRAHFRGRQESPGPASKGQRMRALVFTGQGAQHKGMGGDLFDEFPELTARADKILGYSIAELCIEDPDGRLDSTEYTQPALFVVNALSYLRKTRRGMEPVAFMAGHSLGEYNALFAAGAFDFATGVALVQRRSELMSQARGGGMAAVVGLDADAVRAVLARHRLDQLDLANLNAPDQVVVAGPAQDVAEAKLAFIEAGARAYIPLKVSGAFHSRFMEPARARFADFLSRHAFEPLKTPVIANLTGRPYEADTVADTLLAQLVEPVRWEDGIRYLLAHGVEEFQEIGPGRVLTSLIEKIRRAPVPTERAAQVRPAAPANGAPMWTSGEPAAPPQVSQVSAMSPASAAPALSALSATELGSADFRRAYGVRYAYICGAMYRAIASAELVIKASRRGILSFFGAGGLDPERVQTQVRRIQQVVGRDGPFGVNIAHDPASPQIEERLVDVLLAEGVRNVEASAFMNVTPALVRYRLSGLTLDADGTVRAANRLLVKLSRPEVAEAFLAPAPERLVHALEQDGRITPQQARLAARVGLVDDVCVEGDSGGHTDRRDWTILLPTILRLRDRMAADHASNRRVRVGVAGGIATPETAAAAFLLGADFVVTGSINLCTAESGMSPMVKAMLEQIGIQDTDYAPAGDMFELGSQVQVLKRGVFFPARARKLYDLYRRYDSLDDIDAETRGQLESRYFHRSMEEVWQETETYFADRDPQQIAKARQDPKHKMALVFRWYFAHSQRAAMTGDERYRLDFQVHCGPSLGAFNEWVRGTSLQSWQSRHVDDIAERIMDGAAAHLRERLAELAAAGGSR